MALKKQLRDKDGNLIYPDVGIDLDEVIYGSDPGEVSEPLAWIETTDIKDGQITSAKVADGAITGDKVADYSVPSTKLERTTLYYSESGYSGSNDIPLSDAITNYRFIEVYSKESGGRWLYNKVALPFVGMKIIVGGLFIGSSNTVLYYRTRTYEFSTATALTPSSDNAQIEIKASGNTITAGANAVFIRQIIGYK